MKKLIQKKIISTEEKPFSEADLSIAETSRNRQLVFIVYSYIPLAAILLFVLIQGVSAIYRKKRYPWVEVQSGDEKAAMFHMVAPYVCGFFFLVLTIYFFRFYKQTLAPLIKDAKDKKKLLLYYKPDKTEMGVFNRYYLSSPVVKKQQVEISREDFLSIPQNSTLAIEILPNSQTILRFTNEGKEISVR